MKKNILKFFAVGFVFLPTVVFGEVRIRYFSPNNDGVNDSFEVPVKISDKRYITSWKMTIKDESEKNIIRTIGNKVALPSKLTFKGFFKQLSSEKTGVQVPQKVLWNGAMDNGETAPDGTYKYFFEATDDNGNTSEIGPYTVVIDTVPPVVDVSQPTDKIFGEGAKSVFSIKQVGSKEDKWIGKIKNVSGAVVRTIVWNDSEPLNFNWDGTDDNGRAVSDGVYSYEISATDRAGNVSESAGIMNIIYSAEKPVTNIFIASNRYFSPGTESTQKTVKFNVSIPVPDSKSANKLTSWTVKIVNSKGTVFKTYDSSKNANPPQEIVFDGIGDDGDILPQGRYQAVVTAKYLNGYEPNPIKSPEIILDTTKPSAQLSASEKVFGAGAKTNVRISILADTAGKYALVPSWRGFIYNVEKPNEAIREYGFGEFPPDFVDWNGFDKNGKLSPDGKYKFKLVATDLAGNVGVVETKDAFELNTKSAKILLSQSDSAFSPSGNSKKNVISFTPAIKDADEIVKYKFTVKNEKNEVVKNISQNGKLPQNIVWDGKDDSGIVCEDGLYNATIEIEVANGSSSNVTTPLFKIDSESPKLQASVAYNIFSPDGDGNQDTIPVSIKNCSTEKLWKVEILNSNGKLIKSYNWSGQIRQNGKDGFEWDGTDDSGNKAADGVYSIVISCEDEAGNTFSQKIPSISLDSRETKIYLTTENEGISPNGDKILDNQIFHIKTTLAEGIANWNFDIRTSDGKSVRSWSDKDSANLPANITWDGLDSEGKVCEGTFVGTLNVIYKKGNRVESASSPFVCTGTPPMLSVKTAPEYFSPDNDGENDDLFIRLKGTSVAPLKNWSFQIFDPNGKLFWTTKGTKSITERIIWDGLSNTQKDSKGRAERVQSAMDYPYTFTVTDTLGMTSTLNGVIGVDVLVIRDGDVLKMAVPSIIFRSDAADFKTTAEIKNGLDVEKAANNERVLKRIAEILNKFKDYRVTIEGHANRVTDNELEETEDNMKMWGPALIPLSAKRAEFVKNYLVKNGVSASRLSTVGKGGTELIVDYRDKDNNWKNRRVEFILEK